MNKEPDTYEEIIRKKRCIDLAKYYSLTDDNLEKVYSFLQDLYVAKECLDGRMP